MLSVNTNTLGWRTRQHDIYDNGGSVERLVRKGGCISFEAAETLRSLAWDDVDLEPGARQIPPTPATSLDPRSH